MGGKPLSLLLIFSWGHLVHSHGFSYWAWPRPPNLCLSIETAGSWLSPGVSPSSCRPRTATLTSSPPQPASHSPKALFHHFLGYRPGRGGEGEGGYAHQPKLCPAASTRFLTGTGPGSGPSSSSSLSTPELAVPPPDQQPLTLRLLAQMLPAPGRLP